MISKRHGRASRDLKLLIRPDDSCWYHELVRDVATRKRLRLKFAVSTKTKELAIELHEVPSDRQRIDRTKRIMERVWKASDANYFFTAPSAMNCGGCPFREPCRRWPHS